MAGFVDITLLGAPELQAQFKLLPLKVQKKLLRQGMRKSGKLVRDEARRLVPVDSGALKKSLKVRAAPGKRGSFGIRIMTGERSELGIDPDASGYYPASVEFGSRTQPAQPYLRAAADAKREEVFSIMRAAVRDGIREAIG